MIECLNKHVGLRAFTFVIHEALSHLVDLIRACGPPFQTGNYNNERLVVGNTTNAVHGVRYAAKQAADKIALNFALQALALKYTDCINADLRLKMAHGLNAQICRDFCDGGYQERLIQELPEKGNLMTDHGLKRDILSFLQNNTIDGVFWKPLFAAVSRYRVMEHGSKRYASTLSRGRPTFVFSSPNRGTGKGKDMYGLIESFLAVTVYPSGTPAEERSDAKRVLQLAQCDWKKKIHNLIPLHDDILPIPLIDLEHISKYHDEYRIMLLDEIADVVAAIPMTKVMTVVATKRGNQAEKVVSSEAAPLDVEMSDFVEVTDDGFGEDLPDPPQDLDDMSAEDGLTGEELFDDKEIPPKSLAMIRLYFNKS